MMRLVPALATLVSLFFFPWPLSLALIFVSALFLPPAGLILGIAADALYFMPGAAFLPLFTLYGLFSTLLSLLVHRFVKTRIMEA